MTKLILPNLVKARLGRMKSGFHLLSSNQVFTQIKVTDLEKIFSIKLTIGFQVRVLVVLNSTTLHSSVRTKSTLERITNWLLKCTSGLKLMQLTMPEMCILSWTGWVILEVSKVSWWTSWSCSLEVTSSSTRQSKHTRPCAMDRERTDLLITHPSPRKLLTKRS